MSPTATEHRDGPLRNKVEKVEPMPGSRWARVTVRNEDGESHVIRVRRGSVFANRPKPAEAKNP